MNELQAFNNSEFGTIRMLEENGNPLFCGKDVADALGYSDTVSAIKQHCRGVVKRHLIDNLGRKQLTNFIPEGDLYRLIVNSKLPTAEKFERWVFDEVLPTIRKNGSYSANDEVKINNSRARLANSWLKVAKLVPVDTYKQICASYASAILSGGKEVIPLPAATERLYSATEIGQMLGVSSHQIGSIASQHRLKTPEYGILVWDKSPYSSKQIQAFRYNKRALEKFREIIG